MQTFKKRYRASNLGRGKKTAENFCSNTEQLHIRLKVKTPEQMLFEIQIRSKLSLLKPDVMADIDEALIKQKHRHDNWRF